jgi:hypothetical protein
MSKKDDKDEAKQDKKGKKDKKAKKGKGEASAGPSVASHPRGSYQVRRAKGWGGLAGFAVAAYLSHKAGVPTFDLGIRAIAAGIAGYMLAWACAVTVWRHLVLAELRAVVERQSVNDPATVPGMIPARPATPASAPEAGQPDAVAAPAAT